MKRPRKIAKIFQGRRLNLFAGRWYVAGIPVPYKPDADPVCVLVQTRCGSYGHRRHSHAVNVCNLTEKGAAEFVNEFNTSGPYSFNGRKWATR